MSCCFLWSPKQNDNLQTFHKNHHLETCVPCAKPFHAEQESWTLFKKDAITRGLFCTVLPKMALSYRFAKKFRREQGQILKWNRPNSWAIPPRLFYFFRCEVASWCTLSVHTMLYVAMQRCWKVLSTRLVCQLVFLKTFSMYLWLFWLWLRFQEKQKCTLRISAERCGNLKVRSPVRIHTLAVWFLVSFGAASILKGKLFTRRHAET